MSVFVRYEDLSEEEKATFLTVAECVIDLYIVAHEEGILLMENKIPKINELKICKKYILFLKKNVELMVSGMDWDCSRKLMENYYDVSVETLFDSFMFDMIMNSFCSMHIGSGPNVFLERIASYTGILESASIIEKFQKKFEGICQETPPRGQLAFRNERGTISQEEIEMLLGY